jgi:hypothetical protein
VRSSLHPSESRDVIVQAGALGEHQFTEARQGETLTPIYRKFFQVRLRPGASVRLQLEQQRFVNQPSYAFPWHGDKIPVR